MDAKQFVYWSAIHEAETARSPRHVPRRPAPYRRMGNSG